MKAVIAIDSMKGSLTSAEAGQAAAEGLRRVYPDAEVIVSPLADGGEGTAAALVEGLHGRWQTCTVSGPLGTPVECRYGILPDRTAVMEMSAAAGLTLAAPADRNPMRTTTFGVGEMIGDALDRGCRSFVIGIGGSATNDGGMGMLQALGFAFRDEDGRPAARGGAGLLRLHSVSADGARPELAECTFRVACDVANPLCGPQGCSAVFGPQKGADPAMIAQLDDALARYADRIRTVFPDADAAAPGSGAAGGLGFAFRACLHAELTPGAELVLRATRLADALADATVAITGEGRLDRQTMMGKAPSAVAKLAARYRVPVIAFAGCLADDAAVCNAHGIDAFFPILRKICMEEEAMQPQNARRNLADTVEQVFRLWKVRNQYDKIYNGTEG